MLCRSCGAENLGGAHFCGSCGAPLTEENLPDTEKMHAQRRVLLAVIPVLFVVMVLLTAVVAVLLHGSGNAVAIPTAVTTVQSNAPTEVATQQQTTAPPVRTEPTVSETTAAETTDQAAKPAVRPQTEPPTEAEPPPTEPPTVLQTQPPESETLPTFVYPGPWDEGILLPE